MAFYFYRMLVGYPVDYINLMKISLCYSRGGKCEDLSPELHEKESKVSRTSRNSMYPSAQIKMRWVFLFSLHFTIGTRFPVGKWKGGRQRHERQATVRRGWKLTWRAQWHDLSSHSLCVYSCFLWVRAAARRSMCHACQERLSNCSIWVRAASRPLAAIPVKPIRANALLILISARSRSLPFIPAMTY